MDAAVSREIDKFAASKGLDDPARLKAVAWVESAGVFFWTIKGVKRPAIRFEGHYFYRLLKKEAPHLLDRAVKAGLASPSAGAVKNPSNWAARYELFERACAIHKGIAIRSVSWGIGQVMGEHYSWLGYSNPEAMMEDAHAGVTGQLEVMWRFIVKSNLLNALKAGQWATFAKKYNGPNYKVNKYDTKMAEAYAMFRKTDTGKLTGDPAVRLVQEKLAVLGLYKKKIDGLMGPGTKKAVEDFQLAAGLVVDGDPGSVTVEQLDAFIASKQDKKTKDVTVPALAGGGAAAVGVVSQITTVLTGAQGVADQSKGLLETLNVAPLVTTIIVAAVVVGFVIWYLRSVKSDDKIDLLKTVTNE